MVEDERASGSARTVSIAAGRCARERQEVVDEPFARDRRQAGAHVGPAQPARVGLGLHQVADADEARAPQLRQPLADVGGGQVDPADDARDQRVVEREQLRRLLGDGDGLDHDGRVDARDGGEVVEREGATNAVVGDPRLIPHREIPQMMMRVDDDRRTLSP